MNKKKFTLTISGKLFYLIMKEAKKIGEKNNPQFWIFQHLNNYFKLSEAEQIKSRRLN